MTIEKLQIEIRRCAEVLSGEKDRVQQLQEQNCQLDTGVGRCYECGRDKTGRRRCCKCKYRMRDERLKEIYKNYKNYYSCHKFLIE